MKLTTRCGSATVDGLNEALSAKAVEAKVLRCTRVRVDTTVVPATSRSDQLRAVGESGEPDRGRWATDPSRRRRGPTKDRDRYRAAGRRATT
jgi:IS5 family transposase